MVLHCTGLAIKRKSVTFNHSFYFHLKIIDIKDGKICNETKVVYSNGIKSTFNQSILTHVNHVFFVSSKQYRCELKSNFTGFASKEETSTVVFASRLKLIKINKLISKK